MTSSVCQEELSAAIDSFLSDTEQSVPEMVKRRSVPQVTLTTLLLPHH